MFSAPFNNNRRSSEKVRYREDSQTWAFRGSKSRNKVSVGEPAEGSLSVFKVSALCNTKILGNSLLGGKFWGCWLVCRWPDAVANREFGAYLLYSNCVCRRPVALGAVHRWSNDGDKSAQRSSPLPGLLCCSPPREELSTLFCFLWNRPILVNCFCMNNTIQWITWLGGRWRTQQTACRNVNCRTYEHRHFERILRIVARPLSMSGSGSV